MTELLVNAFITLFVVVDPVGLVAIFGALTLGADAAFKRKMAIRGTVIATVILIVFVIGGDAVLRRLGVSLAAFRIAGGALLFLLAIDMVFARQSGLRSTTEREQAEAEHRTDISVFPLAIPLIAGPGALTTVLLMIGDHRGHQVMMLGLLGVLVLVLLITCVMLLLTPHFMRLLGETGANVISRVLGVVLAALAVQFMLDGMVATFAPA